jgi:hypothetical protein
MTTATTARDDDPAVPVTAAVLDEVADAIKLLDHAVSSGFANATTKETLPETVVASIKQIGALVRITEWRAKDKPADEGGSSRTIKASEWADFESAYYKLARFMSPVTARTLADTENAGRGWSDSPAQRFTRLLWLVAICYATFIVLGEWAQMRYGPVQEGDVDIPNTLLQFFQILIPYAYGGLGACASLLRAGHAYIYERSFDVRRKPEYWNRVVLGTISGGAIILFVNYVSGDNGTEIKLSGAALGFIGGYSTDFLFNTIERVVAAILPKVGISSVRQDTTPKPALDVTSGGLTLKDLLEKYDGAADADKAMYKALIEKLRDRI